MSKVKLIMQKKIYALNSLIICFSLLISYSSIPLEFRLIHTKPNNWIQFSHKFEPCVLLLLFGNLIHSILFFCYKTEMNTTTGKFLFHFLIIFLLSLFNISYYSMGSAMAFKGLQSQWHGGMMVVRFWEEEMSLQVGHGWHVQDKAE